MPATTPNRNYPYPIDTDLIDVADDIEDLATALDTDIDAALDQIDNKVSVSGDTMTGMLTLPGTAPSSLNHAITKGWADSTYLNKTGDGMSGDLDMNGHNVIGLGPPEGDNQATRKSYVDNVFADTVKKTVTTAQTMQGQLRAKAFILTDAAEPSGPWHCVPLNYFQAHSINNPMDSDLNLNGHWIWNSGEPPEDEGHPNVLPDREWVRAHAVSRDIQSSIGGDWQSLEAAIFFRPSGVYRSTVMDAADGANMTLNRETDAYAADQVFIEFCHSVDQRDGQIRMNGDNTDILYAHDSDYRLKERTGDITDAARRVQELARRAFRGHFKRGGSDRDMINAHDVAEAAPWAVGGRKDGDETQVVDWGNLVPTLVSALGHALDRIDSLEVALAQSGPAAAP